MTCLKPEMGRRCYSLPTRCKNCFCKPSGHQADEQQNLPSFSFDDYPHVTRAANGEVPHHIFHQRLPLMVTWFQQFSDVQRDRFLRDILGLCCTSQIHLLSVWLCGDGAVSVSNPMTPFHNTDDLHDVNDSVNKNNCIGDMKQSSKCCCFNDARLKKLNSLACHGSKKIIGAMLSINSCDSVFKPSLPPGSCRLHMGCPSNCQDPLVVLPVNVIDCIIGFLDPQTLARASQVNSHWRKVCGRSYVWQQLVNLPEWRLTESSHQLQLDKYTDAIGAINWREVVAERWRVRSNWDNSRYQLRTYSGHTGGVTCVQFDQHRIVSASNDNTIKVWSMRTNSQWPVQTLVGHSGRVRCLHLSGNRLVSGAADGTIKVWEVEETSEWSSIVCRGTMVGHSNTVRCLQVCSDGSKVVSGSYDSTLKVWHLSSGQCERTLRGHAGHVLSLAVVEELQLIVSGSADQTIKLWSLETGDCSRTLTGHTGAITSLVADTQGIISGSLDSTLSSWDINTGLCIKSVNWISGEGHTGVVRGVAADQRRVVSASDDRTIKIWDRVSLRRLHTLRDHTDGVTCLAFNDFLIVSGSYDKTIRLWDFSVC